MSKPVSFEEALDKLAACAFPSHEALRVHFDKVADVRAAKARDVAEAVALAWREAAAALIKSADGCGVKRREHRAAGKNATSTSIRKWRATEKRLRDMAAVFTERAESAERRAREMTNVPSV